ncbi:MAG: hypothetical protein ACI4L8_10475 [Candidatus Fimadaptatus sp.]
MDDEKLKKLEERFGSDLMALYWITEADGLMERAARLIMEGGREFDAYMTTLDASLALGKAANCAARYYHGSE